MHLATALIVRGDCVLLVASRYASHAVALWNLPGGRQCENELLQATALRELREETGLNGAAGDLAYVAESYDGDRHFVNAAFCVEARGEIAIPREGDHIVAAQWVSRGDIASHLSAAVVREPLLRYLREGCRYTGFSRADISIRWFD